MIGLPFTIRRHSPNGLVDETVYLRSRRTGEVGRKMREALREYHRRQFDQQRAAAQAAMLLGKALAGADALGAGIDLEKIAADQDVAMTRAQELARGALELAELVAALALASNYDVGNVERVMDLLTDRELHAIVGLVEVGQVPADFFASPGIPPMPSATGHSGAEPASLPSEAASPAPTSTPEG
jgi:hypothetical protein